MDSTTYQYVMRNRPPMYGTAPTGFRVVSDARGEDGSYGVIEYDRPLTPREIYRYELVLLSPLPDLPLYPAGTAVRLFASGQISTVEFFDGDWWVDDRRPLRTVADWYHFEPV